MTAWFFDGGKGDVLAMHHCVFREAIVRYDIRVMNGSISLLPTTSNVTIQLVDRDANPKQQTEGWYISNGFMMTLQDRFSGSATVSCHVKEGKPCEAGLYTPQGVSARRYGNVTSWESRDPVPDIKSTLNELSFRFALMDLPIAENARGTRIVNGTNLTGMELSLASWLKRHPEDTFASLRKPNQTVEAVQTANATIFQSQYSYLATALAIILLTASSIVPTFYGWWVLGRPMTLYTSGHTPTDICLTWSQECYIANIGMSKRCCPAVFPQRAPPQKRGCHTLFNALPRSHSREGWRPAV